MLRVLHFTNSSCNAAGLMLSCLCITTNLVDINKLNTLGQVSCFILVCCLGNKQLSVKKHVLVQQLSFMLCGCSVCQPSVFITSVVALV